jgi:hypothetical protein
MRDPASAYRTGPQRTAFVQFARRLADRIDELMAEGHLAGILLCASSPFLEELKAQMSAPARNALQAAAAADLTPIPAGELIERLNDALRHRGRTT